jgi:uncharacterized protein
MMELEAENARSLAALKECPEFPVCNGWCPHERYLSVRHNLKHSAECCGLRELIRHLRGKTAGAKVVVAESAGA